MEESKAPPSYLVFLATSRRTSRPRLLPVHFVIQPSPDMDFWKPDKVVKTVAVGLALETQNVPPATAALVL
jgi:hypothetical protein